MVLFRFLLFIIFLCSFPVISQAKTLLILGDSISAAYGIPIEKGWVSLLEQRLLEQDFDHKVINASIVGETTLGAKMRLHALLKKHQPDFVVIELGGNDGLRGFTIKEIENNFSEMVHMIKKAGFDTLLIPMKLPPNYGETYNQRFASIYEHVSEVEDVALSTFIFENIASDPELMQPDGMHPVEAAQSIMLDNIWPSVHKLINKDN